MRHLAFHNILPCCPRRPASASIPAAAARLKSPLRAGPITSINNTAPAPPSTAVHASPVRSAGPSGRGRSMRGDTSGSRMPNALGLCIGPNPSTSLTPGHGVLPPSGVHNMYASSATGFQGAGRGIAAMSGPMGGPKRALLAEFQGNYGHYGAVGGFGGYQQHHVQKHHLGSVPGKQLLSGQFLMDGLRQQLQQNNYLVQLQVKVSICGHQLLCGAACRNTAGLCPCMRHTMTCSFVRSDGGMAHSACAGQLVTQRQNTQAWVF